MNDSNRGGAGIDGWVRDELPWVGMKIWKKLLVQALAILAGVSVSGQNGQGPQEKDPETNGKQEQSPQAKAPQNKGPQEKASQQEVPQKNDQQKVAQKQTPQAKPTADFRKLDASALPITQKIQIGGDADWIGIGFGSVWVTVAKNNEVVRVDPARNVVQARIAVDKEPCYGIGIGVDRVWVLNCQSKTLTRINPQTNAVDLRVPVKIDDGGEGSIAVDERYVWFASDDDGHASTLMQMDAKTGRPLKRIAVGKDSAVVKLGFGSVWVISSGEGNVYRVDPAIGKVTAMITVAEGPRFSTVAAGSLWVLTQSDGNVSRIDPATNKVVAVIPVRVPGKGGEICYGGGLIWVTMDGNPVTRIDPVKNKVVDQYGNYPKADGIRYGFGSVWVSDHGKGELWRIDPAKMPAH
jgi:streptogramin lyase